MSPTKSQKPIRILFDAHPLIGKKTGIGYYTEQLIAHMAAQYPDDIEFVGYYHNFLLRKPPVASPKAPNIRYRQIGWFPGQIVNLLRRWHINVPIELLTFTKADFIFYPNFLGQPSLYKTPSAPVIHDLTFVDYPETMSVKNLHDLQRFVPGMMQRASFVVTVSEYTKQRLSQSLATPADKIHITTIPPPEPITLDSPTAQSLVAKLGIAKPFLLFLSTLEPRKNINGLLDAYVKLPDEVRQKYSLVLVGKTDWKYADTMQKVEQLQADGHDILYPGYVDDDTRAALYHQARLFVLPSVSEGFGMPILEAMSYDTACVISDIPVFHEVAGTAAAYFDPNSSDDIANVITKELIKPSSTTAQRQQQLATFNWQTVCSQFYEKIRQAISARKEAV